MIDENTKQKLFEAAKKVRKNAYVPYSNFPLSAALLTKEGKIFTGVNIENAAYGSTMCAERTAIFKAVSEGYTDFEALLLISDTKKPVTPCGACRQVISEFSNEMEIIMTTYNNGELVKKNSELLPGSFNKDDME
ncbi:MAG TPA: cytidine deaminase [Halanaerobiales bacterium]|nr:cytidine deaminase [Halanaerobiales bacterium]